MEETTGNRATPYEDFADLFPPASDTPENPTEQPRPEAVDPVAPVPGARARGPERPASKIPRAQNVMSAVQRALPTVTPILALLALAAGGWALWLTHKLPAEMDAFHASLASLQTDVSHGFEIKREVAALTSALQATQSHLAALDEAVARQITAASEPRQLRDLAARLDTLTAAVEELHARATETRSTTSARSVAPSTKPTSTPSAATWAIRLGAFSKEAGADAEIVRLRALDIPAEKRAFEDAQGKTWYRVFVPGFESRKAAESAKVRIQTKAGLPKTWLERIPAQKKP